MAYEGLLAECNRRPVGFRATGDFDLIASPKNGLTPELHAAIGEHKGKIACYLVWAHYVVEWTGADVDDLPPWSPSMKEAFEAGNPSEFCSTF
jgi:hypothetical protein